MHVKVTHNEFEFFLIPSIFICYTGVIFSIGVVFGEYAFEYTTESVKKEWYDWLKVWEGHKNEWYDYLKVWDDSMSFVRVK